MPIRPIPKPTSPRESISVSTIPFEQAQSVLLQGPINKIQLSRQLNVPKRDLTDRIRPYLEDGRVKTQIAPVFENKDVKQRLYFLPEFDGCVIEHIRNILREEFLSSRKIGAMDKGNLFDYIWYGTNAFIKVLFKKKKKFKMM